MIKNKREKGRKEEWEGEGRNILFTKEVSKINISIIS